METDFLEGICGFISFIFLIGIVSVIPSCLHPITGIYAKIQGGAFQSHLNNGHVGENIT